MTQAIGQTRTRTGWRVAAAIVLLGIVVRLSTALWLVPAWEQRSGVGSNPDHHPTLAMSLWQHHELGYLGEGASPTTIRGPGFPSWLAVAIALGIADGRWLGVWTALPTIAIIACFAAWLARRIGARYALLFGVVTLMHPLPAFASSRTMSDEFYAALGLAAVWAWVTALSPASGGSRWWWVLSSGAALAMQILTRSTGLLTLGAIVVATLLATRRARRDQVIDAARSRWRELIVLVLLAMLPALAWSVRSSQLEGRAVFVHSLAAYNFWYGEALDRLPLEDERGRSHVLAVEQILRLGGKDPSAAPKFWYGTLTPHDTAALETRLSQAARENIVEHPLQYLARVLRGMVWFWVRAETRTRTLQYVVAIVPLLLLALYGAWRGLDSLDGPLRRMAHLSVGLLLAHNLVYAATLPMARMCVQVFPLLALLALLGLKTMADEYRRYSAIFRFHRPSGA